MPQLSMKLIFSLEVKDRDRIYSPLRAFWVSGRAVLPMHYESFN